MADLGSNNVTNDGAFNLLDDTKLVETPNIIFDIEDVRGISSDQLNRYKYTLEKFARTIENMSDDFSTNPWKDCQVGYVTNELRHDVETNLKRILPQIQELYDVYSEILKNIQLSSVAISIKGINETLDVLQIAKESPIVPANWLKEEDVEELAQEILYFDALQKEHTEQKQSIEQEYEKGIFLICSKEKKEALKQKINQVKESLNPGVYHVTQHVVENLPNMKQKVEEWMGIYNTLIQEGQMIAEILGLHRENLTIKQINKFNELLNLLHKEIYPTGLWYESEGMEQVKHAHKEAKDKHNLLNQTLVEIEELYELKVLEIDYEQMLMRFKTEYTSPFKIFNKVYKQDKNVLRGHRKEITKKISDTEAVSILMKVSKVHELKKEIEAKTGTFNKGLGKYYDGMNTKWDVVEEAINDFEKINSWFDTASINEEVRRIINEGKSILLPHDCYKEIAEVLEEEKNICMEELFNCTKLQGSLEVEQIKSYLEERLAEIESGLSLYNEIKRYGIKEYNYEKIISDLNKVIRIQEIESIIQNMEDVLKGKYAFLYQGMSTDWEQIKNTLHWFGRFKDTISLYNLSDEFSKEVCTSEPMKSACEQGYRLLNETNAKVVEKLKWFISLFENPECLQIKELQEFIKQIDRCVNNMAALEEWIDYRGSRKECSVLGLGGFIEQVESQHIQAIQVVPTFLKRFYKLWLDAILTEYPSIKDFRRRVQEHRIMKFIELDKLQMSIARSRLRERIINTLPDVNYMTLAKDELGILKRELGKQRKIMPLRKLFKVIPHLLTTLKPCLMMSPLSVSLFLEADSYQFDTIIFDEASQICTEDAIGPIFRGKQVIIAGDNKQLPPTNFFTTSTSDVEFDIDSEEEEDDSEGYESILDEALTCLPERTLKWHYRSRHEHLIAFSNVKIYNCELITFPSAVDKVADNGVEYIYVPNGIYERGGKKCNSIEAAKVAQMVIEHFKKFPYRSLGVVTFSEAQQHAVEMAIRDQRLKHPQYEQFFKEDKEDAFFIKNLENVQGDERDTIIFSIGYGKDSHGKILMNFGPLSRNGGYRRLNVAITRAKYNVKLVGSILPTDIDLDRTNSEGVKMLRSYIEFAIHGQKALENELVVPECIDVDSPFEEAVYDFLISQGYKVATQVGCSGYRIDLAVKHPQLSGRFVLAIECDGATYHSGRTARERDRLRQSVLEEIGWKVYRIWSTDWIKDPVTEGAKLVEAIEEALAQYQNTEDIYYKEVIHDDQEKEAKDYLEIQEVETSHLDIHNPYEFDYYGETDVYSIARHPDDTQFLADAIAFVIETEQPIHYEVLCKRVACLFGNQKATIKVRNSVDYVLKYNLIQEIGVREEFYFIKNGKKVIPRISKRDDELRSIKHISTEELGEGMMRVVSKSYGIHKEDLLIATARAFGYNRKGANITQAVEKAYKYLLKQNMIKEEHDKISMV